MGDFKGRNPALRIHLQYFHKDLSFRDGLYNFSYYRNGKIKDPKCSVLWSCRNKCARNLGRFPKCILIHNRLEVVHCKAFSLLDGSKYKLLKNLKILLHPAALRAFQSCVHRRLEGRKAKKAVTNHHLMTHLPNGAGGLRAQKLFLHLLKCTNSFSPCKPPLQDVRSSIQGGARAGRDGKSRFAIVEAKLRTLFKLVSSSSFKYIFYIYICID